MYACSTMLDYELCQLVFVNNTHNLTSPSLYFHRALKVREGLVMRLVTLIMNWA